MTGAKINLSQGFCCECSLVNIIDETEATRGTDCDLFNFGSGAESAHCLRLSEPETWFKSYTLDAPRLAYDLQVFVSYEVDQELLDQNGKSGSNTSKFREESIQLGDKKRSGKTEVLRAEIVGELQTLQTPPTLSNKVLLLPKYSQEDLAGNPDKTYELMVEREQVSFEGTECNKVGTSFVAF